MKREECFKKLFPRFFHSLAAYAIWLCALAQVALAVDGIAITEYYKYAAPYGSKRHSIVRFDIQEGKTVKETILYDKSFVWWPAIDITGSRIAFWRLPGYVKDSSLVDMDGPIHLSVMNLDGSRLTDILEFPNNKNAYSNLYVNWSQLEWIYYTKPELSNAARYLPSEIWKVKWSDPSTNTLVTKFSNHYILRMAISARGDRNVIWLMKPDLTDYILPYAFPTSSDPGLSFKDLTERGRCMAGCNSYGSPGGRHMVHFNDGSHGRIFINAWKPGECLTIEERPGELVSKWAGLQEEWGNRSKNPRWSCNSDKWICTSLGVKRALGGNQVLLNWVDSTAHASTKMTIPGNIYATSGDFYKFGIPKGCYETKEGKLLNWDGNPCTGEVAIRRAIPQSRTKKDTKPLGIYSLRGELIAAGRTWAEVNTIAAALPGSIYVVRATNGDPITTLSKCISCR